MKECVTGYCPYNQKGITCTSVLCSIADGCYFYCPPVWTRHSDHTSPYVDTIMTTGKPEGLVWGDVLYKVVNDVDEQIAACKNCRWYHGHCVNIYSPYTGEVMGWSEVCKGFERKDDRKQG